MDHFISRTMNRSKIFSKYLSIWHILRILCNNFFQKNLIIYCPNILTSHQRNIILG